MSVCLDITPPSELKAKVIGQNSRHDAQAVGATLNEDFLVQYAYIATSKLQTENTAHAYNHSLTY